MPHFCSIELIASFLGSIKAALALFSRPECIEACNDLFQRLINLCNRDPSTLVLRSGRVGIIFPLSDDNLHVCNFFYLRIQNRCIPRSL